MEHQHTPSTITPDRPFRIHPAVWLIAAGLIAALVNAVAQAGGDGRHEYSVWAWDGLTDSLSRASSVP